MKFSFSKNSKIFWAIFPILIGGLCVSLFLKTSPVFAENGYILGELWAEKQHVKVNEPVKIKIRGEASDGIISLELFYHGSWKVQKFRGNYHTATWEFVPDKPGTYRFCGRVKGIIYRKIPYLLTDAVIREGKFGTTIKYVDTDPKCIEIVASEKKQKTKKTTTTSGCYNLCSYRGQTRCFDKTHYQKCGDYDADPCLEWSNPEICSGSNACGYGLCRENQRPVWFCSNGKCVYRCVFSPSCPTATTTSFSQTKASSQNANTTGLLSFLFVSKRGENNWKKETEAKIGEKLDFLFIIENKTGKDLDDVFVKANLPSKITPEDKVKIDKKYIKKSIAEGFNIGPLFKNEAKSIIFHARTNLSGEFLKPEKEITVKATTDGFSVSDTVVVKFINLKPQTAAIGPIVQKFFSRWYNWIILLLVIILFYYLMKGIFSWYKK